MSTRWTKEAIVECTENMDRVIVAFIDISLEKWCNVGQHQRRGNSWYGMSFVHEVNMKRIIGIPLPLVPSCIPHPNRWEQKASRESNGVESPQKHHEQGFGVRRKDQTQIDEPLGFMKWGSGNNNWPLSLSLSNSIKRAWSYVSYKLELDRNGIRTGNHDLWMYSEGPDDGNGVGFLWDWIDHI